MTLRAVSFGGGVQSTALLVLAATGRIDFDTFVMANVGDDSEDPATLDYVRTVAAPYAAEHGMALHLLTKTYRDGRTDTLWANMTRPGSKSLPIPARFPNGKPGVRTCTAKFKIDVIGRWARDHGASRDNPATIAVGISADEIMRINTRKVEPWETLVYPLVSVGEDTGLHLTRQDCRQVIARAGLPIPPKSACWFCPFHTPRSWEDMQRDRPDLFARAVELEAVLHDRSIAMGHDGVYLTRFAKPLDQAIHAQALLPLEDVSETDGQCDNGWCWT